ncbi:MAG: hypothetical protein Q9182_002511 [Xanthomendoza sp. 2 TL-2023]
MSESPLSDAAVSDAEIETALRNAVENRYRSNPEQLTIKTVRTDVEQQLGLHHGYFKSDAAWNTRSKEVIQAQVDVQEAQSQPPSSQPTRPSPRKQLIQSSKSSKVSNAQKRSSAGGDGPQKRQKTNDSTRGNPINRVNIQPEEKGKRLDSASSSPLSELDGEEAKDEASGAGVNLASESEMSVLLDEDPKPKKRVRKLSSEKPKTKKKESSKLTKASQQSSDPDAEEIKRLQGWLVKCGIRKMWHKELAAHDTSKAKIRHLKDMLTEAGMTGQYSQEKATQIRDARELQADLDAVQAGNKKWGKAESDEDTGSRPRPRLARGLQELDFLKDDDSEEEG